jgi:hypothetical protein
MLLIKPPTSPNLRRLRIDGMSPGAPIGIDRIALR